jgi:uncharacterized protein YbjT (DUF2867 family)
MENFFLAVQTIASDGAVYLPVPGDLTMPMIATTDIAKAAADRILDTNWSGRNVIELVGPEDLTFEGAARTVGAALGKDVNHVAVTPDQAREAMVSTGMKPSIVDTLVEMYGAFVDGKVVPETTPKRGATKLSTFAETVFKPSFDAMTK